jgi:hypothetical protein
MKLLKRVWHDPVGSKVIAATILAVAGLVATALFGKLVPIWTWITTPFVMSPAEFFLLSLGMIGLGGAIGAPGRARARIAHFEPPTAVTNSELERSIEATKPAIESTPIAEVPPKLAADDVVGALNEDLRRFHEDHARLNGRFAEWEEYCRAMVGLSVRWSGEVRWITTEKDGDIRMMLGMIGKPHENGAIVTWPPSFRERAYGLLKQDRLYVTGTIKGEFLSMPSLQGTGFELASDSVR